MITIHLLKEKGFKQYNDSTKKANHPSYVESHQLKVTDEKGIKYFIDIDVWDNQEYAPHIRVLNFEVHAQFNGHSESKNTFNVNFFIDKNTTLDDILNFFENMFQQIKCDYYDAD